MQPGREPVPAAWHSADKAVAAVDTAAGDTVAEDTEGTAEDTEGTVPVAAEVEAAAGTAGHKAVADTAADKAEAEVHRESGAGRQVRKQKILMRPPPLHFYSKRS